ncbi:MAG: hypothetical protein ACTSQA_00380 [Candidatus Heimdallarchaeaceae archaeon]
MRGRPRKEVDPEELYDLTVRGVDKKDIAAELGMSIPTLSARIADIKNKQGLLLQYRTVQNLHLTELQARCLEAITPEKIEEAGLKDLVLAYKVLKDKELVDVGKPTEIRGIMHYLIEIEREEMAEKKAGSRKEEEVVECSQEDFEEEEEEEEKNFDNLSIYTPNL